MLQTEKDLALGPGPTLGSWGGGAMSHASVESQRECVGAGHIQTLGYGEGGDMSNIYNKNTWRTDV